MSLPSSIESKQLSIEKKESGRGEFDMRLLSNRVIYHDGRHNAFTTMVRWKDKYWVAFRNATAHKPEWAGHDGRIMVMSSMDLETWSEPQVVINTILDDRNPTIYVCEDRLFVVNMSVRREPGHNP